MNLDWPVLRRSLMVSGPRPAEDVWDRYVRPQRWPEWSPQIRAVRYAGETLRPQTAGVVLGPGGLKVDFRILEVNPDGPVRSWSWTATAAGVRLELQHTVEATAIGTRTGLAIHGFGPAVRLYLPIARLALHRLVR